MSEPIDEIYRNALDAVAKLKEAGFSEGSDMSEEALHLLCQQPGYEGLSFFRELVDASPEEQAAALAKRRAARN